MRVIVCEEVDLTPRIVVYSAQDDGVDQRRAVVGVWLQSELRVRYIEM